MFEGDFVTLKLSKLAADVGDAPEGYSDPTEFNFQDEVLENSVETVTTALQDLTIKQPSEQDDYDVFLVQKDVLCFHSRYYDRMFNGEWIESKTGTAFIKDVKPHVFRAYIQWLYYNELPEWESLELHLDDFFFSRGCYRTARRSFATAAECVDGLLLDLYQFADEYDVPLLRRAIVESLVVNLALMVIQSDDKVGNDELNKYVKRAGKCLTYLSPSSSLYRFFTTWMAIYHHAYHEYHRIPQPVECQAVWRAILESLPQRCVIDIFTTNIHNVMRLPPPDRFAGLFSQTSIGWELDRSCESGPVWAFAIILLLEPCNFHEHKSEAEVVACQKDWESGSHRVERILRK